jgi:outer membrane protein assembly factor BamB
MEIRPARTFAAVVGLVFFLSAGVQPAAQISLPGVSFGRGDLLISLESGPVQWRLADGTLVRVLIGTELGTGEGMAFDAAGNLYVTRWCIGPCIGGNTVEKFSSMGLPAGTLAADYDCGPHAIVFDRQGAAYVGQAGCTGAILKIVPGQPAVSYPVAADHQGSFWIDLAPDGCTMFYTSTGPNVKRFDVCANRQLPNFNATPLPGGIAHDLRVLADGGAVVSSGEVIVRLNASGVPVQTYGIPAEPSLWAGLELVGDGTFWAANYQSSNVYRFDLATGAVRASFNAGTPPSQIVGIRVRK